MLVALYCCYSTSYFLGLPSQFRHYAKHVSVSRHMQGETEDSKRIPKLPETSVCQSTRCPSPYGLTGLALESYKPVLVLSKAKYFWSRAWVQRWVNAVIWHDWASCHPHHAPVLPVPALWQVEQAQVCLYLPGIPQDCLELLWDWVQHGEPTELIGLPSLSKPQGILTVDIPANQVTPVSGSPQHLPHQFSHKEKSHERARIDSPKYPLASVSSQSIYLFSNLCSASFA